MGGVGYFLITFWVFLFMFFLQTRRPTFSPLEHDFVKCSYVCVQYLCSDAAFRFVISDHERTLSLGCISDSDKEKLAAQHGDNNTECDEVDEVDSTSQPCKKQKLSKGEKKKLRGQNKARPLPFKQDIRKNLCPTLIDVVENEDLPVCNNHKCSFLHDILAYLAAKPSDLNSTCYIYSTQGHCPRGASCRCV
jgi:hypothetical protein